MSLKDIVDRIDSKFEAMFHEKKPDVATLRKYVADRLDMTEKQFASPEPTKGRKWFKVGENSTVSFSPMARNGHPLVINGQTTTFWSSAEFPSILKFMRSALDKGEFDDQLEGDTTAGSSATIKKPRKARDPNAPKAEGRGWSDERRAAFAATIAARKAGK